MAIPFINTAFTAGELTPSLFGHVDLAKYHVGASTMRNMFVSYKGGAYSRAGTAFIGFSKQVSLQRPPPPRLITFQFSILQGFCLEFGHFYMRVIKNGAWVVESTKAISNITNADPAVVTTSSAHGYSNGDWVIINSAVGMDSSSGGPSMVNGQTFVVTNETSDTFELYDVFGNKFDTTLGTAYGTGGTSARIYTTVTPWADTDLGWLKWTQSADTMTICCWNQSAYDTSTGQPSYEPQYLVRVTDTQWDYTAISVEISSVSVVQPPTSLAGTASTSGSSDFQYVATTVNALTGQESVASNIADISNSVYITGTAGSITLTWTAVAAVSSTQWYYNIYKALGAYAGTVPQGSQFGFAGQTFGNSFVDSNITPDFTQVPPLHINPFAPGQIISLNSGAGSFTLPLSFSITTSTGSGFNGYAVTAGGSSSTQSLLVFVVTDPGGSYAPGDTITFTPAAGTPPTATINLGPAMGTFPSTVAYYQQRQVFGGSPNNPDTYWMSQTGLYSNFDFRIPTIASDAITGTPWGTEVNGIQWLQPMPGGLVVFTGLGAWQVSGGGGGLASVLPITPSQQVAQPQAFNGISPSVPPIKINYDILYVQAKGAVVRDLSYNIYANIYTGADLTQISSHLFTGFQVVQWAWTEEPYKTIWTVRDDGALLNLTYLKEENVAGWSRHDTQGHFMSCTSVTEPPVDALYVVTQRYTPDSIAADLNCYMIERMDDRIWSTIEDVWCVDAGLALAQFEPNATIATASPTGIGSISSITNVVGGMSYSAYTTASVVDNNGKGPGFGAVIAVTVTGGVLSFSVTAGGQDYTYPALVIIDPAGKGCNASGVCVLDNSSTFVTNASVFSPADVGDIIRMGGGIAVITSYVSTGEVLANIVSPITEIVPGTSLAVPQPPGSWTLVESVDVIGGLNHLAGMEVVGVGDGHVFTATVSNTAPTIGQVALPSSYSNLVIGLSFTAQLQTPYLDAGSPTLQGQRKKIAAGTVRMEASQGVEVGVNQPDGSTLSPMQLAPTWQNLTPAQVNAIAPYSPTIADLAAGPALPLFTGDERAYTFSGFAVPGQIAVQQSNPLPLNVLAIIPELLPGDLPQNSSGSGEAQKRGPFG